MAYAQSWLNGGDLTSLNPVQRAVAIRHVSEERDKKYLEINFLVAAILAAGSGKFDSLRDLQKELHDAYYPETAENLKERTERIQKVLEEEYKKGELKFSKVAVPGKKKKPGGKRRP